MGVDIDKLAMSLQEKVDEKARKTYGELKFNRWKEPRFGGVMAAPSAVGTAERGSFTIYLKMDGERIAKASFDTGACGPGIISSDAVCELAQGKTVDEARLITNQTILDFVEGLPKTKTENAQYAVDALNDALDKL